MQQQGQQQQQPHPTPALPARTAAAIRYGQVLTGSLSSLACLPEVAMRLIADYYFGRRVVLWESIRPEPKNRPLFDQPDIRRERWRWWRTEDWGPQPSLVLTIGAPGSGKTTWAKYTYGNHAVVAADDWFDLFNNGRFDPTCLSKAHQWCKQQVLARMREGISVVVNNTNTTLNEMFDYLVAVAFGRFPHMVVFARMPETDVQLLARRGKHGVPPKKIGHMIRRIRSMGAPSILRVLQNGPMRRPGLVCTNQVLYMGIFFDGPNKRLIHDAFVQQHGMLLPSRCNFHVTIAFMPTVQQVNQIGIGSEVFVDIVGSVNHPEIQIFAVQIEDKKIAGMGTNEQPHITVATKSIPPSVANHALKYVKPTETRSKIRIKGITGAFLRGGRVVVSWNDMRPSWDEPPDRKRHRRGSSPRQRQSSPRQQQRFPRQQQRSLRQQQRQQQSISIKNKHNDDHKNDDSGCDEKNPSPTKQHSNNFHPHPIPQQSQKPSDKEPRTNTSS